MTYLQRINPKDCSTGPERHVYFNQGELQKLAKLVSFQVAALHSLADAQKRLAQDYKKWGDKDRAGEYWRDRSRTLEKANSWTEIQRNLKAGGETMKQHIEDLEERGLALCRVVDA